MRRFWFFDLDGTLADTDCDIREAWKAALADLGLACPDFDRRFVAGPPIEEMIEVLFPEEVARHRRAGTEQTLVAAIRGGFAKHYDHDGFPNTREYPGVLEAVRRLRAAGDYVAIVTNKRYAGATAMSAKFGWDSIFAGLYAGDMYVAAGGPKLRKPELLARVMAEVGATAAASTMVGDTVSDLEAARKNSIRFLFAPWGYGTPSDRDQADGLFPLP